MGPREQIKHYLDIAYRRAWWILVPLVLSAGVSAFLIRTLPKVYRAATTILVTPQRLPESIVRSTVTTSLDDQMSTLSVQIFSRTYLERIAKDVGLVPKGASQLQMNQACTRLRSQVNLEFDRKRFSYFKITALDEKPERAAAIANELADLFIAQNTRHREQQASGVRVWVEQLLARKKEELEKIEAKMATYRRNHLWELPERMPANLQLLETARQRVATLSDDIKRREDHLAQLRSLRQIQNPQAVSDDLPEATSPDLAQLVKMQRELAELRVRYTDKNPLVREKLAEIEQFTSAHPELGGENETQDGPVAPLGFQAEIARVQAEIATLEQERSREQKKVERIAARVNNTPRSEQELGALSRDYDMLKQSYDTLLAKKEQAAQAEKLEMSQKAEQFQIQDKARIPVAPYKPNPLEVILLCLVGGLGLGVGTVAVLEMFNQTIRNEDEFVAAFPDLPLLVAIPTLGKDKAARGRRGKGSRGGGKDAAAVLWIGGLLQVLWSAALAMRGGPPW